MISLLKRQLSLAALLAVFVFAFVGIQSASADENPTGCNANGVGISLQVYRNNELTVIGGGDTVSQGEIIKYRTTLSALGLPNCNFESGTLSIMTPDGATDVTPGGGIPLVSVGNSFISNFVSYTVDNADIGGDGDIDASTTYSNGQSHSGASHDTASGSVTKQTPVSGTIIIVKDTVPNNGTDFEFDPSWTANFFLDDDVDGTLPNSQTFNNLAPGAFSVTETANANYITTSDCESTDGGDLSTVAAISLQAGETITCTFTNTKNTSLTLMKTVVNDNGGTAVDTAWTLSASGPTPITGVEGNAAVTNATVTPGAYTLSESTGPAGYTASTYSCVVNNGAPVSSNSLSLVAGDVAVCTITNNDNIPKLTLNKIVVNTNGGTALESAWTLTATGPTTLTGPGAAGGTDVVSGASFSAGSYVLSESTGPANYTASTWSCTNGDNDGTISIGLTDDVTCTITNTFQPATLTLQKTVVNDNGGTAVDTAWTLSASGPTPITGVEGNASVTNATVNGGIYNLSESAGPAGYTNGTTWVCTGATQNDGDTVTIAPGQNATCTITNNDNAPSLTLVKTVINDNGGTAVAGAWTLTAANYDTQSPDAGTYNLSESNGPSGYTQTSLTCTNSGSNQVTSVTLGLGENVTCTFVNNDNIPKLTLNKIVVNTNGGTALESAWTLTATGPTTLTGPGAAGGTDVVSGASFSAGSYVLSESTGPANYTASTWSCTNGDNDGTISVGLTSDITCTITNTYAPPAVQGCSPGYWKQSQHFGSYPSGVYPNTLFSQVFVGSAAFPGKTLLQVLSTGGGGQTALGRIMVAAYLNAATVPGFPYTTAAVISAFNNATPSTYGSVKATFEALQDPCPFSRNPGPASAN